MPWGSRHLSQEAREFTVPVLISFETGEQISGHRVYPPPNADVRLVGVRYEVVKALANTDVGLIDVKTPGAAATAITQISIPLSSALGVRGSGTLSATDANLRVGAGQGANLYHELTSSKATAGGKVMLYLYYRRIAPNSSLL